MQDNAALAARLVGPVVLELHTMGIRGVTRVVDDSQQPKLLSFRKFFGEISEDFGEYFALASLRTANARQPYPGAHASLRPESEKPVTVVRGLSFFVFFKNVQRIAMVQFHAHRAQN